MALTLRILADEFGLRLEGQGDTVITGVASLDRAGAQEVAFCRDRAHYSLLAKTRAAAVILDERAAMKYPGTKLISRNPHADFARVAARLHPPQAHKPGVDLTAQVADTARIAPTASIGLNATIGKGAEIGENASIGPYCYIGDDVRIGAGTKLTARVTVMNRCRIGRRGIIHPGAVIGADGFGYAREYGKWMKVPQLGAVQIGDDVEIGACTTIDRGALDDTVIGNGVKIDNQVQVGHNVVIGDDSIIVACVGIGGSTIIGKQCSIGGNVMIAGHLRIADGTTIQATSLVADPIENAGIYSAHFPARPAIEWRRMLVRMQQLDTIAKRLDRVEREMRTDEEEEGGM